MDDAPYREFFARPAHPYHRRYEALRAVFLDGRSQKEVAEQFGYQYSTLRQLVSEFRRHDLNAGEDSPLFESLGADVPPRRVWPRRRGSQGSSRTTHPKSRTVSNWFCRLRSRCV